MKEELLAELGLSKNETKIYLSLLEIGSASMTQIADASGVHRVNVYDSIHKLKQKGLVGEISLDNKRTYQPAPPEALRSIIREKEMKLDKVLPQLQLANKLNPGKQNVQIFEGWDFIRNMFLHLLDVKQDILALDVPVFAINHLGKYFQEVIHTRRAEQKQMMYHIYSKEATERIKFLNALPYTKARYLERNHDHNVTTTICGDEVAIHILHEKEQKPLTIFIKNQAVADAYRLNFFTLWEGGKES